jgi:hypothetical protein
MVRYVFDIDFVTHEMKTREKMIILDYKIISFKTPRDSNVVSSLVIFYKVRYKS